MAFYLICLLTRQNQWRSTVVTNESDQGETKKKNKKKTIHRLVQRAVAEWLIYNISSKFSIQTGVSSKVLAYTT